ncbi:riboflavin synthase [Candidatus Peregrinibacteria bacterium]|nr:MAG: riboflavin synthase [Candidatus Peregrinibacteria bacterium]
MFTGIIETTATVLKKTDSGITVSRPHLFGDLHTGQSIAINGACLTVVRFSEKEMEFDVVPETFSRTNLGSAKLVNLERAMPANGRFEGHIVQGHIDGTAHLLDDISEDLGKRLRFQLLKDLFPFFAKKGSVCINGVSLTLASVERDFFEVVLIPHTIQETNLGKLHYGDLVNIEADIFAKLLFQWHSEHS